MRSLIAVFLGLFLPLTAAHAALMSVDTTFGRATGVIDTTSGLEWLKLPVAGGLSVNQVLTQMAPGGRFEGVHYATTTEFCSLVTPENLRLHCQSFSSTFDVAPALAFFDLFSFYSVRGGGFSGLYNVSWSDQIQNRFGSVASFHTFSEPIHEVEFDSQQLFLGTDVGRLSVHWLVLETRTIPEPATAPLFALGFVAFAIFGSRARRKDRG